MFHIHSFPQCGRHFSSSHNLVTSLLQHYIKSIWNRPCSWILREFPFFFCLYFIHLSLLYFLFCATEIRFYRTGGFCIALWRQTALGVFQSFQDLSFLSCLLAITPGWAISIYLPTPLHFYYYFFFKKRLVILQILADFSERVEQRNLFP